MTATCVTARRRPPRMPPASIRRSRARAWRWLLALLLALTGAPLLAQTTDVPVTAPQRFTGKVNFVTTGGSLRRQSNTGNACDVGNSSTAALTGIPAGTTVVAAYLYWRRLGLHQQRQHRGRCDGLAERQHDQREPAVHRSLRQRHGLPVLRRGGRRDLAVTGNGNFTFSGLTVNTGSPALRHRGGARRLGTGGGLPEQQRAAARHQHLRRPAVLPRQLADPDPRRLPVPQANIDGRVAVVTWGGDRRTRTRSTASASRCASTAR